MKLMMAVVGVAMVGIVGLGAAVIYVLVLNATQHSL